ncbi:hypothetical protein E2C01_001593 [Portunus trituberculatus]|uniref:Uncharacterized protein n=1 Tax=Portunus trituberculatus TaxID=210409 RepID=A0A5B7CJT8_PORTR|nr:hypothetical protein [Portunus trituberculatus]
MVSCDSSARDSPQGNHCVHLPPQLSSLPPLFAIRSTTTATTFTIIIITIPTITRSNTILTLTITTITITFRSNTYVDALT